MACMSCYLFGLLACSPPDMPEWPAHEGLRNTQAQVSAVRAVGGEQRASGAASLHSGERSPSQGVYYIRPIQGIEAV
jgi:hypothetical protein